MRYETVIVGAGMSGLAAGIRLAMFDRSAVILERHALWGGLNSFYTKDGHPFDVGLHALTNFVRPDARGAKATPLGRILRQLRIRHEELRLGEQRESEILLPGLRLAFSNDEGLLTSEVARAFPSEVDGYRRLVERIRQHDMDRPVLLPPGARALLREYVRDPHLIEALLLPALYYGSPTEDDCDGQTFAVLFRSIFLEGLSRPEGGIRTLLNLLIKRYKALGGELRTRAGVRRILTRDGRVSGVELDKGDVLECERVLSCAGWLETMGLVDDAARPELDPADEGRLSFVESISVLDRPPHELGHTAATSFFSTVEPVEYRRPDDLVDLRSGVISAPTNFAAERPPEPLMRLTVLANHDRWSALSGPEYEARKGELADAAIERAAELTFDWRPHVAYQDVFTPRTIRHFTGHRQGAVYGSPRKRWDGRTPVEGLYLCGTDQGFVGIIGTMVSGISMANDHVLSPAARPAAVAAGGPA